MDGFQSKPLEKGILIFAFNYVELTAFHGQLSALKHPLSIINLKLNELESMDCQSNVSSGLYPTAFGCISMRFHPLTFPSE